MEENKYLFEVDINKEKNKLLIKFNQQECKLHLFNPVESEMETLFEEVMNYLVSKKEDFKNVNNNYVNYTKNKNDQSIEELIKQNFSTLFNDEIKLIINSLTNDFF